MKRCRTCGEVKPFADFPTDKRQKKDRGCRPDCKRCTNARVLARGNSQLPPVSKSCTKCGVDQSIDQFNINKWRLDGHDTQCRTCKGPKYKDYRLRQTYGISLEQYQQMWNAQEGKCKICGRQPDANERARHPLNVDHCHTTGRVRGLLCWPCNKYLGYIQDDPQIACQIMKYLETSENNEFI